MTPPISGRPDRPQAAHPDRGRSGRCPKTGDETRFQSEDANWSRNAEEIGALLSGANPNWSAADLTDLLGLHLSLTKQEVVHRLEENWEADVEDFDQIFTEILTLADGIVKQFPDRFDGQ